MLMQPASLFFSCWLSAPFVAGVHILAWQVCLLGAVMALFVPAIAWIEEAAMIVLLALIVLIGAGTMFWWIGSKRQA
jgi:hypothetical protein